MNIEALADSMRKGALRAIKDVYPDPRVYMWTHQGAADARATQAYIDRKVGWEVIFHMPIPDAVKLVESLAYEFMAEHLRQERAN